MGEHNDEPGTGRPELSPHIIERDGQRYAAVNMTLRDILDVDAEPQCSYRGKCNSSRCPKHGTP